MLKFVIFTSLIATSIATYGARKGYGNAPAAAPSYAPPASYEPAPSYQPAPSYEPEAPQMVDLPVQSKHNVKYVDVPYKKYAPVPVSVNIPASSQPVNFVMQSRSSPLNIEHYHQGDQGSYKETSSEDAPHVRVHTVTRPVVQEVREIIAPYRKTQQQIQAVQENSETIIAKQTAYEQPSYEAPKPQAPAYSKPAPKPQPSYAPKPNYAPKPSYAPKPQPSYQKPQVQAYTKPAPKPQTNYAPKPSYPAARRYAPTNY